MPEPMCFMRYERIHPPMCYQLTADFDKSLARRGSTEMWCHICQVGGAGEGEDCVISLLKCCCHARRPKAHQWEPGGGGAEDQQAITRTAVDCTADRQEDGQEQLETNPRQLPKERKRTATAGQTAVEAGAEPWQEGGEKDERPEDGEDGKWQRRQKQQNMIGGGGGDRTWDAGWD